MTEHGHRKVAGGLGFGVPAATAVAFLWDVIDQAIPAVNRPMSPEEAAALGVLIAGAIFYRIQET